MAEVTVLSEYYTLCREVVEELHGHAVYDRESGLVRCECWARGVRGAESSDERLVGSLREAAEFARARWGEFFLSRSAGYRPNFGPEGVGGVVTEGGGRG